MIQVKNLTKVFARRTVVNNLSFSVKPGEILGFLGPNGAGKTTTMRMITGFLSPTRGQVVVGGQCIQRSPISVKRMMGYLPEGAPGYGEMTPRKFLHFIAEVRGFVGMEKSRRVSRVIERLSLDDVADQMIETLSKGFKRRVGLAQAIIHEPGVLILDEPTDGLDPNQKHEVRNLIRGLSEDKLVIISTHILEEVSAVCSRALIISNGSLVVDDTPEALAARSKYHNAVTIKLSEIDRAMDLLRQLPVVAHVERKSKAGSAITVLPKEGHVILPEVNALIQAQGWAVETLNVESGRLDEVFRRLTTEAA